MSDERNDRNYADGVKDGQKGGFLDDFLMANNPADLVPLTEDKGWDTYKKGYEYGQEHRNDPAPDTSSDSGSSSGSSSNCYLTTACVGVMGLNDNCLELTALRNFRDILLTQSSGRRAVKEYEIMAPEVVKAVSMKSDGEAILRNVFREIQRAVAMVLRKDYEGAFQHYKQVTLRLKEKYLI